MATPDFTDLFSTHRQPTKGIDAEAAARAGDPVFKTKIAGHEHDIYELPGADTRIGALKDDASDSALAFGFARGGADAARARAADFEARMAGRRAPPIDLARDTAARNLMTGAMQGYGSQLAGTGPTMALAQGQMGLDQAAQARAAMMGRAPGSAAANRAALLGGNRGATQAAQQMAGTRLAEVGAAQQGYGGLGVGMLRGDTASALQRGGLELDQRRLNDELAAYYARQGIDVGALEMEGQRRRVDERQALIDAWNEKLGRDYAATRARQDLAVNTTLGGVKSIFDIAGSAGSR